MFQCSDLSRVYYINWILINSIAEFLVWKDDEEQRTFSKFSQDTRSWKTKTGTKTKYICHRSGYIRLRVNDSLRKRSFKRKGSCKISMYIIISGSNIYDTLLFVFIVCVTFVYFMLNIIRRLLYCLHRVWRMQWWNYRCYIQ